MSEQIINPYLTPQVSSGILVYQPEFKKFPKIFRLYEQPIVVTEKIDGTNGLIYIHKESNTIMAGSRKRWITTSDDNYGFARFVENNRDELIEKLGDGYHYGEWWGQGIQRHYNMDHRVFSLFNVSRWSEDRVRPSCCDVVPEFPEYGIKSLSELNYLFDSLKSENSLAASKYKLYFSPIEGLMVYFKNSDRYEKIIFDESKKRRKNEKI